MRTANPKAVVHLLLERYGNFEGQPTSEDLLMVDRIISLLEKEDIVEEVTTLAFNDIYTADEEDEDFGDSDEEVQEST